MIIDITVRRVSALTDSEISALLDEHLFAKAQLCLGIATPDGQGIWRCPWCGEVDDRTVASRVFDDQPWHRRQAPEYTIEQIVTRLQAYDESTWIAYGYALYAQILGESAQKLRRTPQAAFNQVNLHLSDRAVGVAALTALGIVDEQGFIREG